MRNFVNWRFALYTFKLWPECRLATFYRSVFLNPDPDHNYIYSSCNKFSAFAARSSIIMA